MVSSKFIIGLLIFILFVHLFATFNHWYWTIDWFDMPMHFFGGFWVAMVYFWLRQKRGLTQINTRINADNISVNQRVNPHISALLTIVSCFGFVALIGVLWEFFEFGYDVLISSKGYFFVAQQGTADTIGDLFFDLLGGLVFLVIYKFYPAPLEDSNA